MKITTNNNKSLSYCQMNISLLHFGKIDGV